MLCLPSKANTFTPEEHGFPSGDSEQNKLKNKFLQSR